jgi:hypothetical protein
VLICSCYVSDIMDYFAVGLHKILSLLESEDVDVRVHAVKVVASLAAEGKVFKV